MNVSSNKLTRLYTKTRDQGNKIENIKKETESLLTSAQINIIMTNPIKTKSDYTQENNKSSL